MPGYVRRRIRRLLLLAPVLCFAGSVSAQCLPSVCSLAIFVQSDPSGITLGGSGSGAATMSLGTMSAYGGSIPSGVTRAVNGSSSWTISTLFDVKVTCTLILNLSACTSMNSPSYNLTAELQTTDTTNTWKIQGSTLSSSSPITITSAGTYGTVVAYTFALTIPFSEAAGTISNTINLTAIAN